MMTCILSCRFANKALRKWGLCLRDKKGYNKVILKTLDSKETYLLYTDDRLFRLMQIAVPDATFGKVKSIAEALYANFKSRMYLVVGEGDAGTIGIIGLSKAVRGEAEIQHFALLESVEQLETARAAFAELRESRRDLTVLKIRVPHEKSPFFRKLDFSVRRYPDNPYGLDGDLCTLKL